MPALKELLLAAQNEENKKLGSCRVTVLKSKDELDSFNGEDDYTVNLPIIVGAYPEGILQAKVREVLPDAVKLAKAVKDLKDKEIIVEEISARNILFKPLKKEKVQTPTVEVVSVETKPTSNADWEQMPTPPAPNKSTPPPTKPAADVQD